MKLDMKSKKNKANSHRGRGKEVAYPDTSDGQKGTLLSMNVSDISNALKAGGIGKRSTAPENPADWTMRANLIPRSIVGLNRDRAIKYLLTYVLIGVLIVSLVVSVFMFAQSTWADHRVEVAQQKTISLQKEKAQFKDVEDTLNSLDDARRAGDLLLAKGAGNALITLGERGQKEGMAHEIGDLQGRFARRPTGRGLA